jgi:aminotransferase
MNDPWIADRMKSIEMSGIRKVFELGRSLADPVNLSIGQPHFDVPEAIKQAAHQAIDAGRNGYTVTQGIAELRGKLADEVRRRHGQADREVLVTSGTSGGIVLATLCSINPGDEVIFFDPYFALYPNALALVGGVPIVIDTYPDFQIDLDRVRAAITPRTKAILVNSPVNPTGVVLPRETLRDLADLACERQLILWSDEVYRAFCYDDGFISPAEFYEQTVVFDGFSKAYGMTGWRLGFAHGPKRVIEEMTKLQQFTFVCAPNPVQHAGVAALDTDISALVADYRRKRDWLVDELKNHYEMVRPGGAFYLFPKVPWGSGGEFVAEAIRNNLLSYAAADATIERGIEILKRLAARC